ncbi:LytTR family DNA-binding domain-containing protein [Thalassomonas haliotis]|uniref:LytTR family transcriptional regulator n=1 Tax=Thalassomonas haliotis TaxID=485448 RepID=A0ABY7VEX6_9GAMM|nr:LytTR family DNA-binding domain-containing protein [Thalassomonas haliotis]WDE12118.1 LytTR family transcriptional regulator [Thalassomonas haliotis]
MSGDADHERPLNILVFLTTAVFCSLMLRSLLKPVAQNTALLKLSCLAVLYSFMAGIVTVQSGFMLLAVLPQAFGGKSDFGVNIFIIITIGWSLFYIFILRHQIINVDFISSIATNVGASIEITLNNQTKVEVSRRQSTAFKKLWSL